MNTNKTSTDWHTKKLQTTFWATNCNKNIIFILCMKFPYTFFKKIEQDLKFFHLNKIYAKKESDANGNFKAWSKSGVGVWKMWLCSSLHGRERLVPVAERRPRPPCRLVEMLLANFLFQKSHYCIFFLCWFYPLSLWSGKLLECYWTCLCSNNRSKTSKHRC